MKLLKTTLLLFWLSINFHLAAQVWPYEDYGQCLIGFRTSDEKVVLEPQFDSERTVWGETNTIGYIVKQGDHFGFVSKEGKLTIPCKYLSIEFNKWGFIVFNDDYKYGILDPSTQVIAPLEYEYLRPLIIHQNSRQDYQNYQDSLIGFLGKKDNQLDLISKNEIKKFGDYIDAQLIYNWNSSPPWAKEMFYIVKDSLNNTGLIAPSGNELLPSEYTSISSTLKYGTFVASKNNKTRLFSTKSGLFSDEFDEINGFQDIFIAWKKDRWCVLDSSFNVISAFFSGIPSISNPLPSGEKYWEYYQEGMETGGSLIIDKNILFYTKHLRSKDRSYEMHSPFKWGLINFKTGATLPQKYSRIIQLKGENTDYYWCYKRFRQIEKSNETEVQIDIYDDQLKLSKSYKMMDYGVDYRYTSIESTTHDSSVFLLRDSETSNYGWLRYSGEPITPFIFKKSQWVHLSKYDNTGKNMSKSFNALAKDTLFALFDSKANQLSEFRYSSLSVFYKKMILGRFNDELMALYDFNGKQLIDNISQIGVFGLYQNQSRHPVRDHPTIHVVHNGVLKAMNSDTTFSVVNDQSVHFEDPVCLVHGNFLIRRDGSVIISSPYKITKGKYSYQCQSSTELVVFSLLGEEILRLDDALSCQAKGNILTIYFRNGSKGLWNISKRRWLISPDGKSQVVDIQSVQNRRSEEFFWLGEKDSSNVLRWTIMNSDGEEMIDFTSDRPNSEPITPFHIVFNGNDQGLIDSEFKLVLPIENQCIFQIEKQTVAYLKNGKWGLYKQSGEKTAPIYDNISGFTYNSKYYVFIGDSLSVLDASFNVLLPPTPFESLKSKKSLGRLLHLSGQNNDAIQLMGLFTFDQKEAGYEMLFNARLLDYLKEYSVGKALKSQAKSNQLWLADHLSPRIHGLYEVFYSKNGFLSQERKYYVEKTVIRETFRFYSDEWHKTTITELILPEKEEELDKMIIDEITRRQSFGFQCVNTPQLIYTLKQNWILTAEGIVFYGFKDERDKLLLRYDVLNPILIQDF